MLEALRSVSAAIGTKKLSAYFLIRGGIVHAFNGEQVLMQPVQCELSFAPKAKAFMRAIKRCKLATIALWINEAGNVMVKSEEHEEEVECAPLDKFPADSAGLAGLWFNEPKKRKPPKPKNVPPEPVWLKPDYLPGLADARAMPGLRRFTMEELVAAVMAKEVFVLDTEVYANYFLCALRSVSSGKAVWFERFANPVFNAGRDEDDITNSINAAEDWEILRWIVAHGLIVTFNGNFFDIPILTLALADKDCGQLKKAADSLIVEGVKGWQILKSYKVKKLTLNHIDLIEVLPLKASLKIYGGRVHAPRMQDLPFHPSTVLSNDQIEIVRWYCINSDLTNTAFCYVGLKDQIDIRASMSDKYGVDLRSKSDAQIAEAVINSELARLNYGIEPERPEIAPGTRYRYNCPAFIKFKTPYMQRVLAQILTWEFWIDESGYPNLPIDPATQESVSLTLEIAGKTYTFGLGGLHSNENNTSARADAETLIFDRDVASYYPAIILNLKLVPQHLGESFLHVYRSIVERRLAAKTATKEAKARGDKATEILKKNEAETLKIVVNGSFGKLGSKWSTLYAPDLMLTVTITGQLCLLMLIESMELAGVSVYSGNTDGITCIVPKAKKDAYLATIAEWEKQTAFVTEETEYSGIFSRDVNNYIAVKKKDGSTKTKGAYFNPWSSPEFAYDRFKKNPTGIITMEAVEAFLTKGTPPAETIRACRDIRKFLSVRTVNGGAVKDGVYLGKAVRWYYKAGETGCIVYAKNGNKVPDSDGARPCLDLPAEFPEDIDFEKYADDAMAILSEIKAI